MSAEALKDLRRLLGMFRALEGAEPVLEAITGAENRAKEIAAEIGKLESARVKADAALKAATEKHDAELLKITTEQTAAVAGAKAAADTIIKDAKESASKTASKAAIALDAAMAKTEKALAEVAAAEAKLADLSAQADAAEKRIADAQAKIQKLLAG